MATWLIGVDMIATGVTGRLVKHEAVTWLTGVDMIATGVTGRLVKHEAVIQANVEMFVTYD